MTDRVQIQFRLPVALHERLTREAAAREVSANLIVVRAVGDFLDRLVPVDEVLQQRDIDLDDWDRR